MRQIRGEVVSSQVGDADAIAFEPQLIDEVGVELFNLDRFIPPPLLPEGAGFILGGSAGEAQSFLGDVVESIPVGGAIALRGGSGGESAVVGEVDDARHREAPVLEDAVIESPVVEADGEDGGVAHQIHKLADLIISFPDTILGLAGVFGIDQNRGDNGYFHVGSIVPVSGDRIHSVGLPIFEYGRGDANLVKAVVTSHNGRDSV